MAHQVIKNDLVLWWPDYYKVTGEVKLDPALSPMENCWKIIDIQVSIWLNKYKCFAYTEDRLQDLEQSARVAVYSELLRRVRLGLYDKKWSFYYNVRSCAWSCMQRVIKAWREQDIIHANELDGDALINDCPSDHSSMTFFDMVATESVPRLRTNSELYCYKITDWHEAKTSASKTRVLNEQVDDEYSRYCEDCAELGVTPVDKVTFVCNSYTDEEKEIMNRSYTSNYKYQAKWLAKAKLDPVWCAKRREYNKQYYKTKRKRKRKRKKTAT